MTIAKDLTGQRFGRLVALERISPPGVGPVLWRTRCDCGTERVERTMRLCSGDTVSCGCLARERRRGHVRWRARCDCGQETVVAATKLRTRHTRSCGCLQAEVRAACHTTHGELKGHRMSPEYKSWVGMIERCENRSNRAFDRYGGRGIGICAEWRSSFETFLAAVGRKPSPLYSIDRVDNDRGYEPGNVRWATRTEQNRNRRNTVWLTVDGVTRPLPEWADLCGISHKVICLRLHRGWSAKGAVTTPIRGAKS
jgi:hypothetical protein